MVYNISNEILEKMCNGKFLKKDMRLIVKEYMKYLGLKKIRGMKEIEIMGKIIDDGILIYEISVFENEYSYWILMFNNDGQLVYDESDGEIKNKNKVYEYYKHIDCLLDYENENKRIEKIRMDLFYPNLYNDIPSYYKRY